MELGNDAETILIISLVLICLLLLLSTITLWFFARKKLSNIIARGRSAESPQSTDPRPSIGGDEGEEGAVGGGPPPVATRPIEGPPPTYDEVCLDWRIKDKR